MLLKKRIHCLIMGTMLILIRDYPRRHSQSAVASANRSMSELRREDARSTPNGRRKTDSRSVSPKGKSQGS